MNKCLVNPNLLEDDYRCDAFQWLGIIYLDHKEYQKAIDYFNKGISLQKKSNYTGTKYLDSFYNNKGIAFLELEDFDSSRVNQDICLNIRLSNEDSTRSESQKNYYIGQSYNNLGTLSYAMGEYDSALFFFEKGLEYREKVENPQLSSFQESEINIAKGFIAKKEYGKAERLLLNLENIYKTAPNPGLEIRLNEELKRLYAEKRDYKKAFYYSKIFYELKDSLYGIEEREEIIRLNLSSQYAEKKLQDSLLVIEKEKRIQIEKAKEIEIRKQEEREASLIMLGLTIALVLAMGLLLLGVRNYKTKKKAAIALLQQKEEVERQRDIAQKQKMSLEIFNKEITDSITYAKRIQNAILPSLSTINEALDEHFLFYQPKAIVAGDFYWVREIGDRIYFAAADCTGHGVPGAFVSIICSNALNRSVEEFGLRETGEILDKTTDLLIEAFMQDHQEVKDGMDISLCCLERNTNKVFFTGANNPLYIIREKKKNEQISENTLQTEKHYLIETKGNKQSIGWSDYRTPYTTHEITIQKGDRIYSFTDGFPDQFGGERGKKYKYKPFKKFLLSLAHLPSKEQGIALKKEFNQWKGDLEQVDDVCVIGVLV